MNRARWRRADACRRGASALLATCTLAVITSCATAPAPSAQGVEALLEVRVVGDAIPVPLATTPGDASRGRDIVLSRQTGLCLLCHAGPFADQRAVGNLAPDLRGAGSRWSEGQLRLRIADGRRLNPQSIMPSYSRTDGLVNVGPAWRGKPILTGEQIEDVVAFLRTLRD